MMSGIISWPFAIALRQAFYELVWSRNFPRPWGEHFSIEAVREDLVAFFAHMWLHNIASFLFIAYSKTLLNYPNIKLSLEKMLVKVKYRMTKGICSALSVKNRVSIKPYEIYF